MNVAGWGQLLLFVALLTALTPPLGRYIASVFEGEPVLLQRVLGRPEIALYRALGVDPRESQSWRAYARSAIGFSAVCFAVLYLTLRTQTLHPLNPEGFGSMSWDSAFNTTASFVSNTSWQFYAGETTLSYLAQMAGIGVHSFLSAAVGLAMAMAVVRGFTGRGPGLGCFWSDLVRGLLYVIVPIAALSALLLAGGGVIQSLSPYLGLTTLTGGEQTLALGPVASQAAIKTLGSVGGGFFNVNSAMPFENSGSFTNFVQMLEIVAVPAALTATFGRMARNARQGWALYAAMLTLFVASFAGLYAAESAPTPAMESAGVAGPNLEGKEQRFGVAGTALYATVTTTGASGAVNGAMESLSGIGGLLPTANILTGELVFGGIGSGLAGMLMVVLLTAFLAGQMIGRTPEYLGRRIGAREVRLAMFGTLGVPLLVVAATAVAIATPYGTESIFASGPQGFSESLYAYASQAMNNGSAFAGYTGYIQPEPGNAGAFGISFAQITGGLAMILGRYLPMIAALAVAGSLAQVRRSPAGLGTLRTDKPAFVSLLLAVIVIVVLLTFVPALLLGPVVQGLGDGLF